MVPFASPIEGPSCWVAKATDPCSARCLSCKMCQDVGKKNRETNCIQQCGILPNSIHSLQHYPIVSDSFFLNPMVTVANGYSHNINILYSYSPTNMPDAGTGLPLPPSCRAPQTFVPLTQREAPGLNGRYQLSIRDDSEDIWEE